MAFVRQRPPGPGDGEANCSAAILRVELINDRHHSAVLLQGLAVAQAACELCGGHKAIQEDACPPILESPPKDTSEGLQRVQAVIVIVERDHEIQHRGIIGRDRTTRLFHLDEARTLRGFWRLLDGFNTDRDLIIGHNVFDFDLSFLFKRSIIHCV